MSVTAARKLTRSQEDYLEAILLLVRRDRVARVRDIAKSLQVGMPSVTTALKALSKRGLVNYDPYQVITLTPEGRDQAEEVSRRHHVLRSFLTDVLGLELESAEAYACRMEHAVDGELLDRLAGLAEFVRSCPVGETAVAGFQRQCQLSRDAATCRACTADFAAGAGREARQ